MSLCSSKAVVSESKLKITLDPDTVFVAVAGIVLSGSDTGISGICEQIESLVIAAFGTLTIVYASAEKIFRLCVTLFSGSFEVFDSELRIFFGTLSVKTAAGEVVLSLDPAFCC